MPSPPPKISVAINNYNYARFLPQAIDSCLAQTFPVHEIIVADDGSTDGSRDILRGYASDPRVRVILQENQGQEAAIQRGFDALTGDWVMTLDADDYYLPSCLETIAPHLAPGVSFVYFRSIIINAAGDRTGVAPSPRAPLVQGDLAELYRTTGQLPFYPSQSFRCFSREFVRTVRVHPNPFVKMSAGRPSDSYLWYHAAFHGHAVGLGACLGVYRNHPSGDSKGKFQNIFRAQQNLRWERLRHRIIRSLMWKKYGPGTPAPPVYATEPIHWERRLLSLRCAPATHPFLTDTPLAVARQALRVLWTDHNPPAWNKACRTVFLGVSLLWPAAGWWIYQSRPLPRFRAFLRKHLGR